MNSDIDVDIASVLSKLREVRNKLYQIETDVEYANAMLLNISIDLGEVDSES